MRAMRAETFSGYQGLKLIELPKPAVTKGKVYLYENVVFGLVTSDKKRCKWLACLIRSRFEK